MAKKPTYEELEQRVKELEKASLIHKQVDEELCLFKIIIESSSESIAISDPTGRLIYINPSHEKLFGRSLDEARNMNYRDYYPQESIEILDREVAPALANGESWEGILDVCDANGRRFPIWERADTIPDEQGRMLYGFGIMHDVSEQIQNEAALKKARDELEARVEERTKELKEATNNLRRRDDRFTFAAKIAKVGTWEMWPENGKLFFDENLPPLLGYDPQELTENLSDWVNKVPAEDYDRVNSAIDAIIQGASDNYVIEHRVTKKNGSIGWVAVNGSRISKPGEKPIKLVGILADITERKSAEKTMRESEEKYRSLVESTEDSIYLVDKNCNYLFMNKMHLSRFGLPIDEILGRSYVEFHSEEATKDFVGKIEQAIESGESVSYEYKSERDGIHFLRTLSPVKDSVGEINAVTVISKDITELKQVYEALRESEEKYRTLFENMMNGFAYCKILLDENNQPIDFVYLEVNDAFEKITGLRKEDVVGEKVTEVIPVIKDSYPELFDIFGKVALTGEETEFEIYFEPLGIWFYTSVYSPQKGYFVAVFNNITDRKKAEGSLRESENKYRGLFEGSKDAVYITSREGTVIDANQSFLDLFGYSQEEIKGLNIRDIYVNPEERSVFQREIEQREFVKDYELKLHKKDEQEMDCLVTATVRHADDGAVLGYQGIIRDVTEQKRVAEALKRSNEELLIAHNRRKILSKRLIDLLEKDRLEIAMELHDHIGQTLTSLKMNLEMIRGQIKPSGTELESQISDAEEKAIQALKDIRSVSHGLRPPVIDTLGLVSSLRELFNETQQHTDFEIRFFNRRIPKRLERGKELAIYRIMQEALSNIIKHARAKNVYVSLIKKEERLLLNVEDNGIGFDLEKAMKVTKRKGPLGLLIMRERAEHLDGDFVVESQIGKGTQLLVEIPV